jgi:hypothetical protein
MSAVQVTVLPPPPSEPLHWLIVTGRADATVAATLHCTRPAPPPPLAEPLHCVTVAPVVAPSGLQFVVFTPPPVPDPMHWSMVAAPAV